MVGQETAIVVDGAPSVALARAQQVADEWAGFELEPSTQRAYRADWAAFRAWRADLGPCDKDPHELVALYLAHMAHEGLKVSTICRALAAIGAQMLKAGVEWSPGHPAIRRQLKSIRRRRREKPAKKLPVLAVDLVTFADGLPSDATMDRAILTVGWFTALRRSNIVRIQREHVTFDPRGFELLLPWSKTNQDGDEQRVAVWAQNNAGVCPVRALRAWLEESGIASGLVFDVSERYVARLVQSCAARAGRDPADFGAHSLRAGLATTADERGRGLAAIMRQTLHKSERVALGYVRPPDLFEGNVTKDLID
jgi:integrase